jgi:DeoR/GlpR family transcriptional regulator of sugar metabolism
MTWIIPTINKPQDCRVTQDELKTLVGQAALQYVVPGAIVGVGTGSTVNKFIDALAAIKDRIPGAVSSSVTSTERLRAFVCSTPTTWVISPFTSTEPTRSMGKAA